MKKFIEWLTGEPQDKANPFWWIVLQAVALFTIFWFLLVVLFSGE